MTFPPPRPSTRVARPSGLPAIGRWPVAGDAVAPNIAACVRDRPTAERIRYAHQVHVGEALSN